MLIFDEADLKGDMGMSEHEVGEIPLVTMAGAFAKRPGMYIGSPVRFDRVLAFIHGFEMAITMTRMAAAGHPNIHVRPGSTGQYQEKLREAGRLRWDRWDLTLLAEALGWDEEEPPRGQDLTEEQEMAAIQALVPLLEELFEGPAQLVAALNTQRPGESGR